jgi:hypothetical protein
MLFFPLNFFHEKYFKINNLITQIFYPMIAGAVFSDGKRRAPLFLLVLLLVAIAAVPIVSAAGSYIISLTITAPEEGGVIYSDVIGSPSSIYVDSHSSNGVNKIAILNGINESSCEKRSGNVYVCENP